MDLNDRQRAFVNWLNHLEEETVRLQSVLERESRALQEREHEFLQIVVDEKNILVGRIEALLAKLPVQSEANEDVLGEMIRALGLEGSQVVGQWQQLKRRMGECKALNEANGATISLLQEHNNRSLVLLFGQRRDRVCYGADGQGQSDGSERLLVTT